MHRNMFCIRKKYTEYKLNAQHFTHFSLVTAVNSESIHILSPFALIHRHQLHEFKKKNEYFNIAILHLIQNLPCICRFVWMWSHSCEPFARNKSMHIHHTESAEKRKANERINISQILCVCVFFCIMLWLTRMRRRSFKWKTASTWKTMSKRKKVKTMLRIK